MQVIMTWKFSIRMKGRTSSSNTSSSDAKPSRIASISSTNTWLKFHIIKFNPHFMIKQVPTSYTTKFKTPTPKTKNSNAQSISENTPWKQWIHLGILNKMIRGCLLIDSPIFKVSNITWKRMPNLTLNISVTSTSMKTRSKTFLQFIRRTLCSMWPMSEVSICSGWPYSIVVWGTACTHTLRGTWGLR